MKKRGGKVTGRIVWAILAASVLLTAQGASVMAMETESSGIDRVGRDMPGNPVHNCTKKDGGKDTTEWSCVYFGSYPQTEVTGTALTAAITGASYDANGDAWVNGTKYRRISKKDTNRDYYFGDSTYRYFAWKRIQWRVLENNGSTLFVVADRGLDCKDYNETDMPVTWENCTLRSWLNSDFYDVAFSDGEKGAIVRQSVANKANPKYGTNGGNSTSDNIFLLSVGEVLNSKYGFCEDGENDSDSRRVKASDYAYARGANANIDDDYAGNCWWWLRSPGLKSNYAVSVLYSGYVWLAGAHVDNNEVGACVPALHINLSSDLWSLAKGTTNLAKAKATLKKASYTYDGKAKQPGVTVTLGSKTLSKNKDYKLTYQNNKKVGTATVKITGIGAYTGSLKKTFKIVPKGTSIYGTVKSKSKGFAVKWKKQKPVTGYQVQYSMDKKFKKKKVTAVKTVKKNSTTKLNVGKLKANQKYYVRIRTYQTVKGKKYESAWSKPKTVRTKR